MIPQSQESNWRHTTTGNNSSSSSTTTRRATIGDPVTTTRARTFPNGRRQVNKQTSVFGQKIISGGRYMIVAAYANRIRIMPNSRHAHGRGRTGPSSASTLTPAPAPSPPILVSLIVASVLCALAAETIPIVQAQCLDKTMTSFERIGGVTIKDAQLTILYQANMSQATIGHHHHSGNQPGASMVSGGQGGGGAMNQSTTITTLYQISTPITAECNNRCRRMKECRAFLVDYSRHTCWSVNHPVGAGLHATNNYQHHMHHQSSPGGGNQGPPGSSSSSSSFNVLDRSPAPIHLELTSERTAYFEKVCLNLPIVECERAWIFERVLSYHIHGHDDKIIDDVPSRLKCQEHCLNERQFRCRSGEYDYLTMQCRLSMVDRHMKQGQFRPTSSNVDYFENQCVPAGQQCDAFDRFEDMDLGRAEIMRVVNNSEQCQQFCTQTIKAFICRSFTWSPLTGRCYLNSANTFMVGGMDKLLQAPGLVYYQRNDCIDLKLECDTTSMTLNLRTNEPFRGRMYVRDGDPQACAPTLGRSALMSSLSIPFQSPMGRCATRELPSRYSSVVVVQQHPLIQRKSDRYIKLVCDFQTANKTISSSYNVMANPWTSTALINATSFAPKILLRITDKFGHDVTGAKLGDELQLRIEAETDSPYDMAARSVLAKSGSSDAESIVLIDRDGCPADFRIFPPLKKLNKRTIIGRFDAFKFSSDAVVRFQVDVQFCLNSCPQTTCLDPSQSLFNVNSQQLDGNGGGGAGSEQSSVSTLPMMSTSSTTMAPNRQVLHQINNNQNDENPLEYMRSSSTTYRPSASGNPDYLATNSLVDQYGGQLDSNTLMESRRSQPPANQPLGTADQNQAGGQPSQMSMSSTAGTSSANGHHQAPTSDQLFDPQAKDASRGLLASASDQSMYGGNGRTQPPLNQHYNHNSQKQAHQQQQQHKQTYGGSAAAQAAAMQSNGLDHMNLSPDELSALLNQQQQQHQHQDQNLHLRRRRRSTEPMPATPKHVPLQREIIIFESSSAKDEQGAANKGASSDSSGQPAARSTTTTTTNTNKQTNHHKLARSQTDARPSNNPAASSTAKSIKRSHHKANNNDQGLFESTNRYDLNQAEQLGGRLEDGSEESSGNGEPDGSRALVCTTWASLAFSMIAFCVIQLLTIGICLAGWLHKNKPKQTGAQTMMDTQDEQHRHNTTAQRRFLSQILGYDHQHHHHHHQEVPGQGPAPPLSSSLHSSQRLF